MAKYFLLAVVAFLSMGTIKANEWTWRYSKLINENDYKTYHTHGELIFSSKVINHFSQLMFSWNALRPLEGYFSFIIQVRDAASKKWGEWHHMIDWGKNVQISYANKGGRFSDYLHVRLEMRSGKVADAFRVKILPRKNADIANLKSFTVVTSDYGKFVHESAQYIVNQDLTSVLIHSVPQISQIALNHHASDRICSPTSCSMLTAYLTGQTINPHAFADSVYDSGLNAYGSWPFNTAHAFEHTSGSMLMFPARLNSFIELHKQLKRGIPVVVSVRGALPGAVKVFQHGHLMVVIGYDARKKEVICHDPAFKSHEETRVSYPLAAFIGAWELSRRFVYWAEHISQA